MCAGAAVIMEFILLMHPSVGYLHSTVGPTISTILSNNLVLSAGVFLGCLIICSFAAATMLT